LTRRANHWHIAIIEELQSPREKSLRAFSLSRHHQSDGGAPRQDATPLYHASSDSAPSSELPERLVWPARANVPAGGASCARPRPLCSQGIGFAPKNDRVLSDHAAQSNLQGWVLMTAYLILFALVGLVAIAVWERFA
jgi:hypothetical protein